MKKSNQTIIIITILLLLNVISIYPADYNGRRDWMLQPTSARVASMGKAFAGTIDNANTVFWNPGGAAFLKNLNIEYSHIPRIYTPQFYFEYEVYSFAFNANFRKSFVIGLNLQRRFLLHDNFSGVDFINPIYDIYQDSIIGLLFGYRIGNIGIGINTKFLSSSTKDYDIKNIPMALDIGTLYSRNFTFKNNYIINTNLGFSILNISNGVKYKSTKYYPHEYTEGLPNIIRIGYSTTMKPSQEHWKLIPFNITHNFEYSFIINNKSSVGYKSSLGLGLEAVIYEFLYSRTGYYYQKGISKWSNNYDGMTYGIGLNLPLYHFVKLLPLSISYDYGKIPSASIIHSLSPSSQDNQSTYSKIHSLKINFRF